jgi:hypothetical protein
MVRIFEVGDLQARKRALVAESELYRQTLALEVHNFQLYASEVRHKIHRLRIYKPFFLAAPVLLSLLRSGWSGERKEKRQTGWRRALAMVLMGWRAYRKFGPVLQAMILQQMRARDAGQETSASQSTPGQPAAAAGAPR